MPVRPEKHQKSKGSSARYGRVFQAKSRLARDEILGRGGVLQLAMALAEQLLFPGQRVRGNGIEVVVSRRPVERAADAAGVRDHGHDIARSALGMLNRKIAAGDA